MAVLRETSVGSYGCPVDWGLGGWRSSSGTGSEGASRQPWPTVLRKTEESQLQGSECSMGLQYLYECWEQKRR